MPDMAPARVAVVVTTINGPNLALKTIARGCEAAGWDFFIVGDTKSPPHFDLPNCKFFSLADQISSGFSFAASCPTRHYARKNVGYLLAIRNGANVILETDDDNIPERDFWSLRPRSSRIPHAAVAGWVNVYRYFTDTLIWPRGLPLDCIRQEPPRFEGLSLELADCPIQQGLADNSPDVDAIYRLVFEDSLSFRRDRRVALSNGTWCPFNSQNTTWFRDAFPLLYLPAYCSFRMTDIWRSFVAQRIAWENGWSILFHEPTVHQERNPHDLMRDFSDEVSGYLNNRRIGDRLAELPLRTGSTSIPDNMLACYRALVEMGLLQTEEMPLLDAWLSDLASLKVS